MADVIKGKVWSLDTAAGVVTTGDVVIHSIMVAFTTAAAGSFQLTFGNGTLLDLVTTAASTAAVWDTTKQYYFGDQTFQGPITKALCVNVKSIYIITGKA